MGARDRWGRESEGNSDLEGLEGWHHREVEQVRKLEDNRSQFSCCWRRGGGMKWGWPEGTLGGWTGVGAVSAEWFSLSIGKQPGMFVCMCFHVCPGLFCKKV